MEVFTAGGSIFGWVCLLYIWEIMAEGESVLFSVEARLGTQHFSLENRWLDGER